MWGGIRVDVTFKVTCPHPSGGSGGYARDQEVDMTYAKCETCGIVVFFLGPMPLWDCECVEDE